MASINLNFVDPEESFADASNGHGGVDVRAIELLALVEEYDVSVRLRNSIFGATAARALPFKTVGEYADAGAMAQTIMLRDVRNFGRKTARELDALVHAVFGAQTGNVPAPAMARASPDRAELLELFAGETVEALVANELLSARLSNVLAQPALRDMSFAGALENFQQTISTMLRQRNCGRKSVNEFRQFCERHVRSTLISTGYADPEPLIAWLLGGTEPCDFDSPKGSSADGCHLGTKSATFLDPHAPPEHATLVDRLEWLLSELDARAQSILCRRNGIGQAHYETLEEIGCDMSVTRERIRQIEAKSLKRMRIRVRRAPIKALLQAEGAEIWLALSGDTDILLRVDLQERQKRLPPYVRLALDIEARNIESLLDDISQAYAHGWLSPHVDPTPVEAAANAMAVTATLPLPQSIAHIAGNTVAAARAAAAVVVGKPVRYDYLMPPRVGVRLTRLVRLHALLFRMGEAMALELLVRHYRALFEDDPCTERDAEIVMDAAPHLFLEIAEGSWSAIGQGGAMLPFAEPEGYDPELKFEEPGTIAHALQVTLDARGPTRLVELLDDADDILPDGRSVNSIGPVLLTRRELFVRALPGVYALPHQIPDVRNAMPECWPILFNDSQARIYALARYAGEPRTIFPLWSSAVEYELCRWARHSSTPEILASLLDIAVIEDWPISSDARVEWKRIKRLEGRFELGGSLRHTAAYERPTLDRVFAACRYATAQGQFNWIAGNRLTGRKIDSHGGAGLVALLLRLGAIEEIAPEGYRWQRPHRATERAAVIAAQLDDAFSSAGDAADWQSEIGQNLACLATQSRGDDWVDGIALAAMFLRTTPEAILEPEDDDPLAQLLAAQRRARESERREKTLDWLLED